MTDRNYVLMILQREHDRLAKQIAEDIKRQHYADASRCSDMATEILTGMMVIGASDQFDDPMVPPDEDDWLPDEVFEAVLGPAPEVHLPALLVDHLGVPSRGEARRLIAGGTVRLDGEPVEALDLPREALVGRVLQRGRSEFVRLVAG